MIFRDGRWAVPPHSGKKVKKGIDNSCILC